MKQNLAAAVWRLTVFVTACGVGAFAVFVIFAQIRFEPGASYRAIFTDVTGLKSGNFVRIAGVEVGKVGGLAYQQDGTVQVDFTADESVRLTKGTKALIRFDNLYGDRYLELQEGPGPMDRLTAGGTIPVEKTAPALDLDALLGGFRPLFQALDPDQVNALSGQLIQALQGQGASIGSFLTQTAALTNTLADRDDLIGQVIDNLNTVLQSLGDQSKQLGGAVDSLSELITGLNDRRDDVTKALAYGNAAGATIADLLQQARPLVQNAVHQSDRINEVVMADHDFVDDLLNTLPDAYQTLARQGLYGDYYSFYTCDLLLKVNGKGGQPVYIKVAGQSTGRCAPK